MPTHLGRDASFCFTSFQSDRSLPLFWKSQIRSTKSQTSTKFKIQRTKTRLFARNTEHVLTARLFRSFEFEFSNLFGAWDLEFGIFVWLRPSAARQR